MKTANMIFVSSQHFGGGMATWDLQNNEEADRPAGFLRSLFGPSKKEIWRQLAAQISGDFQDGGFLGRDRVVARTDQWTVTLDHFARSTGKSSVPYTRMRAPYVNKDGFKFTIYRAGVFSALGEMLGMYDIRVGDPAFDEAFVVKANSEDKVAALLASPGIRALMGAQPRIRMSVKDDEGWFGKQFPAGVDEIYFEAVGIMKDLGQLHALFELFSAVQHQLCHIGSAYESDPGLAL
jgi:hypothetical protein